MECARSLEGVGDMRTGIGCATNAVDSAAENSSFARPESRRPIRRRPTREGGGSVRSLLPCDPAASAAGVKNMSRTGGI